MKIPYGQEATYFSYSVLCDSLQSFSIDHGVPALSFSVDHGVPAPSSTSLVCYVLSEPDDFYLAFSLGLQRNDLFPGHITFCCPSTSPIHTKQAVDHGWGSS